MQFLKRLVRAAIPAPLLGRWRGRRVRSLVANFEPIIVQHRYGAVELRVFVSDPLARGWYDHDWAPLPELAALQGSSLKPGSRVFDIGAHQGVVAMMLASQVGATGTVLALEPNPHNCSAARKNAVLNALSNVTVLQGAISDRPGTIVVNEGLNAQIDDGSGAGGRLEVPAFTLDGLAHQFGQPDVVMLDVEGAECLALKGAATLLQSPVDFCVEVHVGCGLEQLGGSVETLLAFFPPTRFALSVRAEPDERFRSFSGSDPVTAERFFLLAAWKGNRQSMGPAAAGTASQG